MLLEFFSSESNVLTTKACLHPGSDTSPYSWSLLVEVPLTSTSIIANDIPFSAKLLASSFAYAYWVMPSVSKRTALAADGRAPLLVLNMVWRANSSISPVNVGPGVNLNA